MADPVHDAVRKQDITALRALLQANPSLVNTSGEDGVTPIHIAASMDKADVIELLIAAGANINAKTVSGATALHWAALANASRAADMLVRKGADVRAITSEGLTALQVASQKGSAKVAETLKSAEAALWTGIVTEPRFVEGRQALERKEAQQAFDIFMELLRKYPESMDVNYALGEAAYAAGKYSHAALAFERIVATQPDNQRARLDLARTYFAAKQLEPARREFESVLAHNPPATVRKNIQDFLGDIRRQEKRSWVSGRIDAGMFHDDNANVGPEAAVINIAPIIVGSGSISSLAVSEDSLPIESWGLFAAASASTCYDVGRKSGWMLVCDGIAYHSWLEEQARDEETFFLSLTPGLLWAGEKSVVRIPVKASYIAHGGESLVSIYGAAPSVSFALGQAGVWNIALEGAAENRNYADLNDRDGSYFAAGARIGHSFGKHQGALHGGASVFHEKTAAAVYENTGVEASVGGDVRLRWKMAGYAQAKWRIASYAEQESLAPEKRHDNQYQFTLGLRKALSKNCGVDLNYQHTRNDSTFDLYGYERNVVGLSVSYSF